MNHPLRFLSIVCLLCLGSLLVSCSDDTTSPNDDTNGTNGTQSNFTIASIDEDSVYWGERVTVTFRNATSRSFLAFVHTMPMKIDSMWCDDLGNGGMSFRMPERTSSGQIRLYDSSFLAKDIRSIYVFPKLRSALRPFVEYYSPRYAYRGDPLLIKGRDFPIRRQDISVRVNDLELPIESWDSSNIFVRVSPETQSGPLTVRLFDAVFGFDSLFILEHEAFLPGRAIRSFRFYNVGLLGTKFLQWRNGEDTVTDLIPDWTIDQDLAYYHPVEFIHRTSDSVTYVSKQVIDYDTSTLELRLKMEPESRVSGIIRLRKDNEYGTTFSEVEIRGMRWWRIGTMYRIYSLYGSVKGELVSLRCGSVSNNGAGGILTYTKPSTGAYLTIDLETGP